MCNTGILSLSGQKSIKLECFSHRHLNRKARPSNKGGGKKVTGQLLIYTESHDMHIIISCEYLFIHATKYKKLPSTCDERSRYLHGDLLRTPTAR